MSRGSSKAPSSPSASAACGRRWRTGGPRGGPCFAAADWDSSLAPFVIAFVLAPLLEQSLRESLAMSPDGAMIFVRRPGTALMLVSSALLVALMVRRKPKGGN